MYGNVGLWGFDRAYRRVGRTPVHFTRSSCIRVDAESQWQLCGSRAGDAVGEPGGDQHLQQIPGVLFWKVEEKWRYWGCRCRKWKQNRGGDWLASIPGQTSFCLYFSSILPRFFGKMGGNHGRKMEANDDGHGDSP